MSGVNSILTTAHDITMFISYMSCSGKSPSTITTYASMLMSDLRLRTNIDLGQFAIVQRMLRGVRKSRLPDKRLPISIPILLAINSALNCTCSTYYEAILFRCIFSVAFHALLRVSEYTQSLNKSDIKILRDSAGHYLSVNIGRSKTDQLGTGVGVYLRGSKHKLICPVRTVRKCLALRPDDSVNQPFFVHLDLTPVTPSQVNYVLKSSLEFINVPYSGAYSSHSFRIGGCSTLAAMGKNNDEIMQAGRWKSSAFKSYVRHGNFIPW